MNIIPSAEPFFFPGGPVGCLMIHGFTGAPKEMRWMGEYLAERGYSVLGVRLAGHATRPEDMIRTRYTDWMASVEDGWHLLNGVAEQVFVIGLSMGGTLALRFSADFPVAGTIALSTPYDTPVTGVKRLLMPFIKPLSLLVPYLNKGPSDWRDKEAEASHVAYPQDVVRSGAEINELLAEMREASPGSPAQSCS